MRRIFQSILIVVACAALIGAGATLAFGTGWCHTPGHTPDDQYKPKPGDEGCSHGYWKQVHKNTWFTYKTTDYFDKVFGVKYNSKLTLLGALKLTGGGYASLAREATAALLNAANPNVNFGLTQSQIIAMVQKAFSTGKPDKIKDQLEAFNTIHCPIDGSGKADHHKDYDDYGKYKGGWDDRDKHWDGWYWSR